MRPGQIMRVYDLTRAEIAGRRTAYYRTFPEVQTRGPSHGIGGYLDATGATLEEGSGVSLRVDEANTILHAAVTRRDLRNIVGYWTDDDGSGDGMVPVVARLPRGRFLAGWTMGAGMTTAFEGDVYTNAVEAAEAAHAAAAIAAERERDYQREESARLEEEAKQEEEEERATMLEREARGVAPLEALAVLDDVSAGVTRAMLDRYTLGALVAFGLILPDRLGTLTEAGRAVRAWLDVLDESASAGRND